MDLVEMVEKEQESRGISDKTLSNMIGVSEYYIYKVKDYRQYLTKLGYYAFCGALGLEPLNESEVDLLIAKNRERVGSPDTNIELAVECANPEYVLQLEKEINARIGDAKKIEDYKRLVAKLRTDLSELSGGYGIGEE